MDPDSDPRRTFWSIPPYRRNFRRIAKTIKVREVRGLIAFLYGNFYFLYGQRIPVILWLVVPTDVLGPTPAAIDFSITTLPYLMSAVLASMVICGCAAAGIAWFIMGRTIEMRRRSRTRFVIWAALAMGAPQLSAVRIAPPERLPIVLGILILMLLFGAGLGLAWHAVLKRDEANSIGAK